MKKKDINKVFLIRCPNCFFEQQTFEKEFVFCSNENCNKQIDVQKNLIRIVNGVKGNLGRLEINGNPKLLSL